MFELSRRLANRSRSLGGRAPCVAWRVLWPLLPMETHGSMQRGASLGI